MASCKYNPGINSVNPYAVLNVTQQSQSVASNKSVVRWELVIYRPSAISSSASKSWSVTINGTPKSGTTTIGGSGTKTIASGTVDVSHNSDGTKSISFSFSLQFDITWNGRWIGTGSASGNMALSTIPRATTPSLNPTTVTMGNSITISLPRASSSFTHTLQHDFYVGSWTTFATGATTSATLSVPVSWASRGNMVNQTSGSGRIRCLTYNGSTLVGEKIVNFKATVPSSVVPTISSVTLSEAASLPLTGAGYIQGYSKVKGVISASGAQGSTIKSYSTKVGSATHTGSTFTSDVLTSAGSISIVTTVTDSRGRTASTTKSITVVAYAAPVVTMSVFRATNAGAADDEGTYVVADLNIKITALSNKNANSYKIEYKQESASSWTSIKTGTGYTVDQNINLGDIANEDLSYNFRVTVTDSFTTVIYETSPLPTSFTLVDYKSNGKGIAFGRVSTTDTFRVGMTAEFDKAVTVDGALTLAGGFKGIAIQSGTDFNDLITPGFYYNGTSSVIASCKNYPEASALSLEVYQASGVVQVARIYDDATTYTRAYYSYNKTWSPWVKIIRATDISDCIKIVETSTGSITLAAHASKSIDLTAPTLSGYKCLMQIGGKGVGDTGLLVSCGSTWVFNTSASQKTFSSISWYWLFVRNV